MQHSGSLIPLSSSARATRDGQMSSDLTSSGHSPEEAGRCGYHASFFSWQRRSPPLFSRCRIILPEPRWSGLRSTCASAMTMAGRSRCRSWGNANRCCRRARSANDCARNGEFGPPGAGDLCLPLIRVAATCGILEFDLKATAEWALWSSFKRGFLVRRVGASNAVEIALTAPNAGIGANGAACGRGSIANDVDLNKTARQEWLTLLPSPLADWRHEVFGPDQLGQFAAAQDHGVADARARWRGSQAVVESYQAIDDKTMQRPYSQTLERVLPSPRVITAAERARRWPYAPLVFVLATALEVLSGLAHTARRFATGEVIAATSSRLAA
jgi:hypothetical protein